MLEIKLINSKIKTAIEEICLDFNIYVSCKPAEYNKSTNVKLVKKNGDTTNTINEYFRTSQEVLDYLTKTLAILELSK